jgi:Fe-S-cluster-containing dehydrogenase component
MDINRRDFLKVAASGGVLAATSLTPYMALAREKRSLPREALGILYDATVCIGCKACQVACKKANDNPPVFSTAQHLYDNPTDLDAYTFNIIKLYKNGSGQVKDREKDGYSFIKRHCMHCVDPSCVSACPVSALTKDPKTGIVSYNKSACIGCRYCQVACPYLIPKFEWDQTFPRIKKCQLCDHLIAKGGYSQCCEHCPTGASIFGKVTDLIKEAQRRLALKPGEYAEYPLQRVDSERKVSRKVTPYIKQVFGLKEGGGTQYLMLANVPFTKLGLPDLPDYSDASWSEGIQHTVYKGFIAPIVVFGGLVYAAYRSTRKHE